MKPANTLAQDFFKLKDKLDKSKCSHAIYKFDCQNCDKAYVGETNHPIYIRTGEHQKEANSISKVNFTRGQRKATQSKDFKSAITEHVAMDNHQMNWDKVKCVEQVNDWHMRGIKEAIHIRNTNPNMNRPQGERHILPHVWDELLVQHPGARTRGGTKI